MTMIAIWVKVRVKPQGRQRFLEAIEADALGSERDEKDCFRFNVLQDEKDENIYYFYEVYKDQARARGASQDAALREVAGRRRHAGRAGRADALQDRLPDGRRVLGQVESLNERP